MITLRGKSLLWLSCVSSIVTVFVFASGLANIRQTYSAIRGWWRTSDGPASNENRNQEILIRDEHGIYTESDYYSKYIENRDDNRESSLYRDGLYLKLPLSNGEVKVLKDNPCDCDSAVAFDFLGYLPEIDVYLIEQNPWEGEGYLLVSRRNGKTIFMPALPHISPNGRRVLAAYNCEEGECYYSNSITILYRVGDELVEECYSELDWLPSNAVWLNDETLRLDRTEADAGGGAKAGSKVTQVVVERQGGIWGPPASHGQSMMTGKSDTRAVVPNEWSVRITRLLQRTEKLRFPAAEQQTR